MKPNSIARIALLVLLCASLGGCEQPNVYGSVSFSSYSGSYHGGGVGGGITIGGRIR